MIGVVADDITGANDIGAMFTIGGYTADVYGYDDDVDFRYGRPDVIILDTNSRLDAGDEAYKKVRHAVQRLQEIGCTLFFNKTCSVFRGNIGPEFDAMLDQLEQDFAVVVVGFPKNGRKTVNGIHYVHGVPLAESEFQNDPIHPMTESNLVKILSAQTTRGVGLIEHTILEQGVQALRNRAEEMRNDYDYVIIDVEDQDSLRTIARAFKDEYILCGSSALGEELPGVLKRPRDTQATLPVASYDGQGILCVAGSLMPQTRAQVEYSVKEGLIPYELDTVSLMEVAHRQDVLAELKHAIITHMNSGRDVVLHSSNDPDVVAKTKELGAERGLTDAQVGRVVSQSLTQVVVDCLQETGQIRFLTAGGETSNAICQGLGITGMRVWKEIQPGVPSCYSLEQKPRLFVLKSGSFGKPDFFVRALEHMKQE